MKKWFSNDRINWDHVRLDFGFWKAQTNKQHKKQTFLNVKYFKHEKCRRWRSFAKPKKKMKLDAVRRKLTEHRTLTVHVARVRNSIIKQCGNGKKIEKTKNTSTKVCSRLWYYVNLEKTRLSSAGKTSFNVARFCSRANDRLSELLLAQMSKRLIGRNLFPFSHGISNLIKTEVKIRKACIEADRPCHFLRSLKYKISEY